MSSREAQRLQYWERLESGVSYPSNLPVARRAPELVKALQDNPVTIIAGETGSGKTTQVPKCCVQAGLGQKGRILLTQPRRLAAVRTAARLAEEWDVKLGEEVGYRIRFDHRSREETVVEVVTDGIPVSGDLSKSPFKGCEIVIVDEVHERSVNIDLLLGLLKLEREKNPSLKVALMSATLDLERYQEFFPEAVVVEVEGRTFPVDIRYQPLVGRESLGDGLARGLEEELKQTQGDILVFLPTERDIRDNEDRLRSRLGHSAEVLPLFSRLPAAQQDRVFRKGGKRKIILSTNIAETSLTLPGVRVVIDSGLARVLRYQSGRGVPLLEVEWVSKASARQRTGRAGRVAPGRCLRLYDERTHLAMEDFTTPEIRRQDLASVILKLVSMGIHSPEAFPFPDAPSPKAIRSGCRHLEFLGAINQEHDLWYLTPLGRRMVSLPVAPRLAHLLLGGRQRGMLEDVSTVAAFLSIPDPRQSPADQLARARDAHRKFSVEGSDFLSMIKLFERYSKTRKEASGQKLRKWCEASFLSWKRMKEWDQLRDELLSMVGIAKRTSTRHAGDEALHRVLLASHLDCILEHDERSKDGSYRSLERTGVVPHPSSILSKSKVKWGFCASFLNTSRLFALHVGSMDPSWLLEEAKPFLKISRGDPRFDTQVGCVVSEERYAFRSHQVHVVPSKDHFDFDPDVATETFVREALVRGGLEHPSLDESRDVLSQLEQLDGALRIRSHLFNEDRIVEVWQRKLGKCSRVHDFLKLSKTKRSIELDDFLGPEEAEELEGLPLKMEIEGGDYQVSYTYRPGQKDDGVTIHLDLDGLSWMTQRVLESSVPAYLEERFLKAWESLPRAFRKKYDLTVFKEEILELWERYDGGLNQTFDRWFGALSSSPKVKKDWLDKVDACTDAHLIPAIIVGGGKGRSGERQFSIEEAQVHSKGAMARRHERQWTKRLLENLDLNSSDPWENLDQARRALLSWPVEGKEAQGLDGKKLLYWPRLEKWKHGWRLFPVSNQDRAWQHSQLALASLLGEGEEKIKIDPDLLDRIHRCGESVAEVVSFLEGVARGSLWLRLRFQDLETLEGIRARLRKVRDRYLEKDVKRHLTWIVECLELVSLSRRCPVEEPSALWVQEWCSKLAGLRKDTSTWLGLDHRRYVRELGQARALARIWIHRPHEGDDAVRLWRDLEKDFRIWRENPLNQLRGKIPLYWEEELLTGKDEFHLEVLKTARAGLNEKMEATSGLEIRLSKIEEWILEAELDLEVEKHPKTRNRKKKALEEIKESQSSSREKFEAFLDFLDRGESLREQWGKWGGTRERILDDEKVVEKDKLSSVLSQAWGAKRSN